MTPFGGSLWFTHASVHAMPPLSTHIGSGPGEEGTSGMQTKPFVPLRTVRIFPFSSKTTTSACFPTAAGAALSALAIACSSVTGRLLTSAERAGTQKATAANSTEDNNERMAFSYLERICPLFLQIADVVDSDDSIASIANSFVAGDIGFAQNRDFPVETFAFGDCCDCLPLRIKNCANCS